MDDILSQSIDSGLAAFGKTAVAQPVSAANLPSARDTSAPPAVIDTTPPPLAPLIADANADDIVSVADFGDLLKVKTPVAKSLDSAPIVERQVTSRDTVLTELNIPQEQWPIFRKMANESFNHVVEVVKKQRATEGELKVAKEQLGKQPTIPASWYEHEDGYTLHPTVKQASSIAQQANFELQHWNAQYDKIAAGEDWADLEMDAKGQYVTVTKQSSPSSQRDVLGYITQARAVLNEKAQYINNVKAEWKGFHSQYVNGFKQAEDTYFPQYKDSAANNQHISTMQKLLAEKGQGNNPLNGMFAKLYAFTMEQKSEIDSLKTKSAVPAVVSQPPASAFNGSRARVEDSDMVSVDMFSNVINRR